MRTVKSTAFLFLSAALFAFPASGEPVPQLSFGQLLERSSCLSCHAPDNQMRLPDWKQVADRYKGKNDAANKLKTKIARGGSGMWGNMDMPPYPELSDAELEVLVRGILDSGVQR